MTSSRIVSRLSSRVQSLANKLSNKNASPLSDNASLLKSASQPVISKRFSFISRLPVELSSLTTMMPLHSAIASARLQSNLSIESQSWGLVPQVRIVIILGVVSRMHRYLYALIVRIKARPVGQGSSLLINTDIDIMRLLIQYLDAKLVLVMLAITSTAVINHNLVWSGNFKVVERIISYGHAFGLLVYRRPVGSIA